jgi:pimeloyl-ACP methyl ester carboxylesterase
LELPEQTIEFVSKGTTLRGWWIPAENPKAVAIYAHGYVMNRCELLPEAMYWQKRGVSALLFDHRAHGKSGGSRCGFGLTEAADIIEAVELAKSREPNVPVILVGSSMGSAAIAMAASQVPDIGDGLILDSAYSKLTHATLGWWRFVGGRVLSYVLAPVTVLAIPIARFNPFKVDVARSLEQAGDIPVLLLHGDKDILATPDDAARNLAACKGKAELVWFEGCGHSEGRWLHPVKYRQAIAAFLSRNQILIDGTNPPAER